MAAVAVCFPSSPLDCLHCKVLLLIFLLEHPWNDHTSLIQCERINVGVSVVSGLSPIPRGSHLCKSGAFYIWETIKCRSITKRICCMYFVIIYNICSKAFPTWKSNYTGNKLYIWEHRIHNIQPFHAHLVSPDLLITFLCLSDFSYYALLISHCGMTLAKQLLY